MASSPAAERPLRADARRNRERVLAAARECFAEHGLDAQMDDVARRAQVGVGTVYRHFPDKRALVTALAADRFAQLTAYAREALAEDDPWASFCRLMWRSAALQAEDRALSQVMASTPGALEQAREHATELHGLTARVIARGQEAGVIRPDVRPDDVPMIMCGLGRSMEAGEGCRAGARWERYLAIVLDGMRAPAAEPLPE